MNANQTATRNAVVSVIFKNIKGTSFVGIRDYVSKPKKEGDVPQISNQTFLVGVNRRKRQENDLAKLKNFDLAPVIEKYGKAVSEKAHLALMIALEKVLATDEEKAILRAQNDATINRSDAQKDAYHWLCKGLKMHKETEDIYVDGYCVNKTVIQEATKHPDTRRDLTKAKDMIKKLAEYDDRLYRCFKVGNKATLRLQGIELPW